MPTPKGFKNVAEFPVLNPAEKGSTMAAKLRTYYTYELGIKRKKISDIKTGLDATNALRGEIKHIEKLLKIMDQNNDAPTSGSKRVQDE